MPSYSSTSFLGASTAAGPTMSTAPPATAAPLPITSIQFPHSSSQIPLVFGALPSPALSGSSGATGPAFQDRLGEQRFRKLNFATYDGTEDPPKPAPLLRAVFLRATYAHVGPCLVHLLSPDRGSPDMVLCPGVR